MKAKIPAAVLGATGSVGQRFIQLLDQHPLFEVTALTGSDRSIGQKYKDACHWILPEPMPERVRDLVIVPTLPEHTMVPLVFSALPADTARQAEPLFAQAGVMVCSNASAFRMEPDVPILLPEVNPEHTSILNIQREKRGWKGGIVTNPNCTSTGMTVALKALQEPFGLKKVFAVSLQALSGAGFPGVASLDILDNVIPNINGEEAKVETEPRKMLGKYHDGQIEMDKFAISAHTNRVAVSDGHIVCLSVGLENLVSVKEAAEAFSTYQASEIARGLPSSPQPIILLRNENDRPQPRLDRSTGHGMTTVVGRLRPDPMFDLKFVVLSHNTIRGAAGGSIYNAELLLAQGWIA